MNLLSRISSIALAAAFACCVGACTQSDGFTVDRTAVDGMPHVSASNTLSGQAKVLAVDYDRRSIALSRDNSEAAIFTVPPHVRNFRQIKQGDMVKVRYEETLNVTVRKGTEPLSSSDLTQVAAAPQGEKPEVVAVRLVNVHANVQDINHQARTVTLLRDNGGPITVRVHDKLQAFDRVAKGDHVVVSYTETVHILVTP